jgi:hypothetical protein
MGGACSTYGGRGEVDVRFWWGNLRERGHLKDPGVDGSIILKWIFRKWDEGMNWIDLVPDRDRWRAVVNAVMKLRVPKMQGIFGLDEGRSASQSDGRLQR